MNKDKYITTDWRTMRSDILEPDPRFPPGHRIKPNEIGIIYSIVEKSHGHKGYKLISVLAIESQCFFLFKRKNFFGL